MKHEPLMQTQEEFLAERGLFNPDTSLEELEQAKREYQKAKKKVLSKRYRQNRARIELWVLPKEAEQMSQQAASLNFRKGQYLRWLHKSHHEQTNLLPNPEHVHDLVVAINRLGNTSNQVAAMMHQLKMHPTAAMQHIHTLLEELKDLVQEWCTQYKWPSIEAFFTHGVAHDPAFLDKVRQTFYTYISTDQTS